MKKLILLVAAVVVACVHAHAQEKPDTMWFQFNDRFTENEIIDLTGVDSIEFAKTRFRMYKYNEATGKTSALPRTYRTNGVYRFDEVDRYLVRPNTYSGNNFMNENSTFCFQRSVESEHFVLFWAKGLKLQPNGNLTGGASSSVCNVNTLLNNAEKIWDVYVDDLGFLEPGKSTTDRVKIEMFIVNQSDWRADGSGTDGAVWTASSGSDRTQKSHKVGLFHCNAWAASSDVTVAHEIGHTFQYLVSADLGSSHGLNYVLGANSSGNEWWEDCANWQVHKVYPAEQFASNWSNNQDMHHLNIIHEGARYNNCYYQDWWCQLHGLNTVARVWRESVNPEDPIQAYMRLFGHDEQSFADEQFAGYAHIAAMDIDAWHTYGQGLIGSEQQRLQEPPAAIVSSHLNGDTNWWIVDPAYCPQNYGYNANPLKVPAVGTVVKATFKGLSKVSGYRSIHPERAGWRYGFVTYAADGTRTYSPIGRDADGEVSFTIPEGCTHLWFVVMGAPTKWWTHSWNDNDADDEQWPYAVRFVGSDPYGVSRNYDEYPADYQRRDTTVVINANLAYSSSNYSSVRVQYDMDAISQALGLSTAQMRSVKVGTANKVRFVGVSSTGAIANSTTTSTSSATCFGHWFNQSGNVCGYDSNARIFAEFYPDKYGCYVGQYPGRLKRGNTYIVRQAIIYTHTDGKEYRATMQVNLTVK